MLKPVIRRRGITTVGPPSGSSSRVPRIKLVDGFHLLPAPSVVKVIPVRPAFDPKKKRLLPVSIIYGHNVRTPDKGLLIRVSHPYQVVSFNACQWSGHFASRGWTNIQDQMNAGYPIYIQPTLLTGSYEEVVDFGTVYNNVITTLTWVQNLIAGAVAVLSKLATSTDNLSYTSFTTGTSLFAASLRYVKFRFEFTASEDHGLVELLNVQTRLDVKREVDSGSITADKNDVSGTLVTFNKTFKSIDSITLTVNSVEPVTAIYFSVTTTNFRVYAMDSQGNRITYTVSWKARGVV